MKGARRYAELFETGQYERLYFVSTHHPLGKSFRIYVLPEGEKAKPNGTTNPPLNSDAIEVYGALDGESGWNAEYGWLHIGKWQEDFYKLVEEAKERIRKAEESIIEEQKNEERKKKEKIQKLLATY